MYAGLLRLARILFSKERSLQILHPTPNPSPSSCRRHAFGMLGGGRIWCRPKFCGYITLAAATSSLFACTSAALAADKDPPVPPGRDPGGIAIAIIGPGLDYTLPQISEHLARDGEGEIIGWDFVDDDRRPFESGIQMDRLFCPTFATFAEDLIHSEARHSRVVPVRVAGTDALQLGRAAAYVGQSPAKIALVIVASSRAEDWNLFRKAAEHYSDVLFIAAPIETPSAVQKPNRNVDNDPIYPVSLGIENILSVTDLVPSSKAAVGPATIDIAGGCHYFWNNENFCPGMPHVCAATNIAALASRIVAKEPELKGKALKDRILSFAAPLPEVSKSGKIEQPWYLYPDY